MPFFIIQELFLVSIGIILILLVRKIPQVEGFNVLEKKERRENISNFIHSTVEKFDYKFARILEKILRKLKIFVMRLDNCVSKYLNKTKINGDSNKNTVDDILELRNKLDDKEKNGDNVEMDRTTDVKILKNIDPDNKND